MQMTRSAQDLAHRPESSLSSFGQLQRFGSSLFNPNTVFLPFQRDAKKCSLESAEARAFGRTYYRAYIITHKNLRSV